jgi:hypothetical protein
MNRICCSDKNSSFLQQLRQRLDFYGIKLPSVLIEYRDLTLKTDALVGSAGIPTLLNVPLRAVQRLLGMKQQTVEVSVLNKMSGVLKPSHMTLLLGPPGCGKSSFLKVSECNHFKSCDQGAVLSQSLQQLCCISCKRLVSSLFQM